MSNIESNQEFIIKQIGEIKRLVELNYKEVLKNRVEILKNRKLIKGNHSKIVENRRLLETIIEKLDVISKKITS